MDLSANDFSTFFRELHGYAPFPWQAALVKHLSERGTWPDVLELPTGSGKTAAIDAGVFHLALCYEMPSQAALRIALVVDRRLVVDDAFSRAEKIERLLHSASNGSEANAVVKEVARRLQRLAGDGNPPLAVQRLRGGVPLEHDWARTPTQPTVLCSTVDQVGSRLLFRGYGVSDRMKPVHAGLLGVGSLVLLDEVHLAEPFRQTLDAIQGVGRTEIKVVHLSATPGVASKDPFVLSPEDRAHPELKRRLETSKPARLCPPIRRNVKDAHGSFALEAKAISERLLESGVSCAAVGVIVNRVELARKIFCELKKDDDGFDAMLMIGRSRDIDRDEIANRLGPFRTGDKRRTNAKPLFIVATQCLEVGVDLDLDGLVTQAAPLDALRQRFGRLNRAGRPIAAEGTIIAIAEDIAKSSNDPVYGDRIRLTWEALESISNDRKVEFGIEALPELLRTKNIRESDLYSVLEDAPVLMPAYLDLWSQTWPRPTPDPEVELFLHGAERKSAGVSIVWRSDISEADIRPEADVDLKELIRLVPPQSAESIELPLWTVRRWLRGDNNQLDISDSPEREPHTSRPVPGAKRRRTAFRWAGYDDPRTKVVAEGELRTGDLIIVPSNYGGCDEFGWTLNSDVAVVDVADSASKPYWGRRCAVRVARDVIQWESMSDLLLAEHISVDELVNGLLQIAERRMEDSENKIGDIPNPRDIREALKVLQGAHGRIDVHTPYAGGREGGAVLITQKKNLVSASLPATEDDGTSQTSNQPVYLDDHGHRVAQFAKTFARTLGLEDLENDLHIAAYLHDAGKSDPRFQAMLAGGDIWNRPDKPLAKSKSPWSASAWKSSGLPKGWRHEALSVQMSRAHPKLAKARDPALVLWLIGSHHGFGRPFFSFIESGFEQPEPCLDVGKWEMTEGGSGPQSTSFDFDGLDWPSMFIDLKRRYGIWGLAHLEAILRLADHRASEEEQAS